MIRVLQMIPLLGILLFIYYILVKMNFFPDNIFRIMFHFTLPSNAVWKPTYGDLFILLGLLALYIELFKATRTSEVTILDHLISTFVLIIYLAAWLIYPWGGNSVFLTLASMSFIDVIAGFTITISSARRDLTLGGNA